MDKNSYTVEQSEVNFEGGRYISKNPMSAAKKAASRMFKMTNKKKIKFSIRRTTQGEEKKVYHYEAVQVTLKTPVVLKIKGKEIVYRYNIEIIPLETASCNKKVKKGGYYDEEVMGFDEGNRYHSFDDDEDTDD